MLEQLQAMLDAIHAARSLTVMRKTEDGLPVIGAVGWGQLQSALSKLNATEKRESSP